MRATFQALAIFLASALGVVFFSDQSPLSPLAASPALVPPAAALLATFLLLAAQWAIYRFSAKSRSGKKPQSGAQP